MNKRSAKAEEQVKEALRKVEETVEQFSLSDPTPARNADEAKEQATRLREAIGSDLQMLQAKLPPGEELAAQAKTVGGVLAAVTAGVAAVALALRKRGAQRRRDAEAEANARAIARYLPQAIAEAQAGPQARAPQGRGGRKVLGVAVLVAGAAAVAYGLQQRRPTDRDIWGAAS